MGKMLGCLGVGLAIVAGLIVLAGVWSAVFGEPETEPAAVAPPPPPLSLTKVSGKLGGFDSVLILSGEIANAGPVDLKDPMIGCDLLGPSGTKVGGVNQRLFEVIPAGGSKRFRDLNMGFTRTSQAVRFTCAVGGGVAAAEP